MGLDDELLDLNYTPSNTTIVLPEGTIVKRTWTESGTYQISSFSVENLIYVESTINLRNFTRPGVPMRYYYFEGHSTVVFDGKTHVPLMFAVTIAHPSIRQAFPCKSSVATIIATLKEVK